MLRWPRSCCRKPASPKQAGSGARASARAPDNPGSTLTGPTGFIARIANNPPLARPLPAFDPPPCLFSTSGVGRPTWAPAGSSPPSLRLHQGEQHRDPRARTGTGKSCPDTSCCCREIYPVVKPESWLRSSAHQTANLWDLRARIGSSPRICSANYSTAANAGPRCGALPGFFRLGGHRPAAAHSRPQAEGLGELMDQLGLADLAETPQPPALGRPTARACCWPGALVPIPEVAGAR